jgi:hypothetical protein
MKSSEFYRLYSPKISRFDLFFLAERFREFNPHNIRPGFGRRITACETLRTFVRFDPKRVAMRKRKTLVVCRSCHEAIHYGKPKRYESVA